MFKMRLILFPGSFRFILNITETDASLPFASISKEEANPGRSEVSLWLLTGPDTGREYHRGLTLMLMNCGAESHVCGGLRDGDSIARHAACSLHGLGETGSQHGVSLRKTVWIRAPARDRRRRTKKGLFQPEMSVNRSMELSVEVLDNPLAS